MVLYNIYLMITSNSHSLFLQTASLVPMAESFEDIKPSFLKDVPHTNTARICPNPQSSSLHDCSLYLYQDRKMFRRLNQSIYFQNVHGINEKMNMNFGRLLK